MANKNSMNDNQSEFDLRKYHVDYDSGFMLKNPLKSLPPYFEPWNELASSLPVQIQEKTFRDAVDKLPLLDHSQLVGHHQLRLAHLQLSFITTGYIWQNGDSGVVKVLPKCVAIPYCKISELLGIQAILSHVDLALANWSLIDPNGAYTFENLECLYHLPGGKPGDWFCLVTFMVELSFAKCLKSIAQIVTLLGSFSKSGAGDAAQAVEAEIAKCLQDVAQAMTTMQDTLARMRDNLEAKLFFNVLRPFLGGWGGESNPLPDGIVYEGVSDTPVKLTGGSAAQSSTLQVVDALLGVKHTEDKREFLIRMRDFMPPDHKRLIEDLELLPNTLRQFVTSSTNEFVKSCYNESVTALTHLRDYHMKIVKMYVILPSQKANEGNYGSLDKKGTGGTSLIPFLTDIWSDTKAKLLPDSQRNDGRKQSVNIAGLTVHVLLVALTIAAVSFAVKRSLLPWQRQ